MISVQTSAIPKWRWTTVELFRRYQNSNLLISIVLPSAGHCIVLRFRAFVRAYRCEQVTTLFARLPNKYVEKIHSVAIEHQQESKAFFRRKKKKQLSISQHKLSFSTRLTAGGQGNSNLASGFIIHNNEKQVSLAVVCVMYNRGFSVSVPNFISCSSSNEFRQLNSIFL